jgi:hypothetical protein
VLGRALLRSLGGSPQDLRELSTRRKRHAWVMGSSGYSGYELAPEAAEQITLTTVRGDPLQLPLAADLTTVSRQPAYSRWSRTNPHRGQWAPGVDAKERPSWMGEPA